MTSVLSIMFQQVVEHPLRIIFEIIFAAALMFALIQQYNKIRKSKVKVAAPEMPPLEEQERRIAEFKSQMFRTNNKSTANTIIPNGLGTLKVDSRKGCYITVQIPSEGENFKKCLDLATEDFHSFSTHPTILSVARQTVMAYGVGSCGPRGFYGTIKPHMDAEVDIAKFLNVEDCAIYSFSFATVSTLISCFAGRGEYLVVDDGVSLPIIDGCILSRANLLKYRHSDMLHLEERLKEIVNKENKEKKISRRFIVTEGLFRNTGDICNLPKILELCERYKFRIILEDSYGFGCLGPTGRGTPEHFGFPCHKIDLYVGSMSTSLGAVGGFCAGARAMVEFQRLAATAYVFSASLPPYITAATSAALTLLNNNNNNNKDNNNDNNNASSFVGKLHENAKMFREMLRGAHFNAEKIIMIESTQGDVSPIIVLCATESYVKGNPQKVEEEMEEIVQEMIKKNVLILRHLYSSEEQCNNSPRLRILLKSTATKEELTDAAKDIIKAVKTVFP